MGGALSTHETTKDGPVAGAPASRDASPGVISDRMTLEWVLYAAIFGAGLFLRLFRLGLAPMSESEAAQALAALRGTFLPTGGSPLLYGINAFLFSMVPASDALARLAPALIGSAVVLSPALFRDALGRFGALGASVILAFSPLMLVGSRSLSGEIAVIACVLLLIAFVRRTEQAGDRRSLIGAAAALGVGLASGAGMYTALMALGASVVLLRWVVGRDGDRHRETPPAMRSWSVAGAGAAAFVLAATGGLARLVGLGAAGDLLTAWLNAFGAAGGSPAVDMAQILIVYEGFALIAGAVGLSLALSRADRFGAWLGFAAILSTAIVMLQPGRQPQDLMLPITLLALLAGYAIQPWAEAVNSRASIATDGVVMAIGGVIAGFMLFQITAFVRGRFAPAVLGGAVLPPEVTLLGLFIVLIVVVGSLLTLMVELRAVLRALATLGLLILLLGALSAGWGATQERVGDPREIVWGAPVTPVAIHDLVDTAEQVAVRAIGGMSDLPIQVETDDPVVLWYLRAARIPPGQTAAGVVTPFGQSPQADEAGYRGASFDTRSSWSAALPNFDAWLEWFFFRESSVSPPQATQSVTLWARR